MTTVDEAREALQSSIVTDATARQVIDAIDAFEDAIRAEYAPKEKAHRQALWDKFTGGEKLAYGIGYRDSEAESAETLAALREAVDGWTPQHSSACAAQDDDADCICGTSAVYAAALAATPAEEERT